MKTLRVRVLRWQGDSSIEASDELASEEPLEMRVGETTVGVTMRTPGHDTELITGFLLTEGLIVSGSAPLIRQDNPNRVTAALPTVDPAAMHRLQRYGTISSSCGVCGKGSIESVLQHFAPIEDDDVTISRCSLNSLAASLVRSQPGFERTGGVHAAGLFDSSGNVVVVREDIGRHNAVDKTIGYALLRKVLPLTGHTLLVSGRVSFDIVQKALGARIPVIAAVSAPSSLAVQFAEESGQTLVGFLRNGRFNVYTHPHRIVD
jgi:FdhD protein